MLIKSCCHGPLLCEMLLLSLCAKMAVKQIIYKYLQAYGLNSLNSELQTLKWVYISQVRVTQGKEPPCFLQLFKGHMIIHKGKREDESTNTSGLWRLYIVLGEYPDECHLLEVPCKMSSLRSRASMILLNVKTGILHVWHGSKSATHTRQRAVSIGKALEKRLVGRESNHCKSLTWIGFYHCLWKYC